MQELSFSLSTYFDILKDGGRLASQAICKKEIWDGGQLKHRTIVIGKRYAKAGSFTWNDWVRLLKPSLEN